MSWIDRIFSKGTLFSPHHVKLTHQKGLDKSTSSWTSSYGEEVNRNLYVCPKCGHHMRIDARGAPLALLDEGSSQKYQLI